MKHGTPISDYMNPRRWMALAGGVIGFSIFCSLSAFCYTYFSNAKFGPAVQVQAISDTTILSFALAVPVLTLLGLKLFEVDFINLKLEHMASTDLLTECLNRRALLDVVDTYMKQTGNDSAPRGGAFLVIDVDHFKRINDRLGHVGGDAALRHVAMVTKQAVRDCDVVARIGGEEFAIFLPGVSAAEAQDIAERVVEAVHDTPFTANGNSVRLAVSLGGALFDVPEPFERLYKIADANLYSAKQNGRDQAVMPQIAA